MPPRFTLQDPNPAKSPPLRFKSADAEAMPSTRVPLAAGGRTAPFSWYALPPGNFREAFCRRFAVAPERFEIEVLHRGMSWRARIVGWLVRPLSRSYYSVDELFVRSIGRVQTPLEFKAELMAFRDDPANRCWARRVLKLRLSVQRVLDIADVVLPLLRPADWHREMGSRPPWN